MNEKQNLILVNEFEKRAKERRENILHFQSPNGIIQFNSEGFDFTKVTGALLLVNGKSVPLEKTNTWASLLRSVNMALKQDRDKYNSFEDIFNLEIKNVVNTFGIGTNSNFSRELFTDEAFIKSQIYKNNKNHALEIWRGKKICAVYAGEVVIVLNALIAATGTMEPNNKVELFVSYKKRRTKITLQVTKEDGNNLLQVQMSPESEKKIKESIEKSINRIFGELDSIKNNLKEM